ncbi:restriction endonuclease subunit S [Microcystis aeruginosa FBCC-A68]|uniref:restriction endonuclease subunit S n=1 Tax=Microcystis aeruginosa TaxID=1126 RepID=UPI0011165AC2|nr:restriction endonuclease subunit S [Microcystis aeruginosa]
MKVKSEYPVITLGKLAEKIDYGFSASATDVGDGPKFLRITDIQDDHVNWLTVPLCEADKQDTIKYALAEGDIVFARTGATTGKSYLIRHCPQNSIFASYLIRVRPSKDVDSGYLSRFFQTSSYWRQINLNTSGTAQGGVNATKLKTLLVPLPPLEEQRRIAAILDKADGVRRKRKEAIRLTEELLKSTFLEMFGDPVTNPKGWEKIKLGNLCTIVRGGSPRPINDYLGGSIPWIKIGDATEGDDIYIHKTAEAIKPDGVKKSRYLEPGSLIFANCGVSLGFARILKIAGCIHDGWLALSDLDKSINQIFLLKLLNSITEHFRAIAPAGTQPNLNTTIMKNFEIPVPPIDLQEKFAVVSHYLTDSIQKNSEMFKESENLFNSLLQRAFRGEL